MQHKSSNFFSRLGNKTTKYTQFNTTIKQLAKLNHLKKILKIFFVSDKKHRNLAQAGICRLLSKQRRTPLREVERD